MMTHGPHLGDGDSFPRDQVHVYALVVPAGYGDLPIGRSAAARVLSPGELERFDRARLQRRRNDLVLSRVLLRAILKQLGLDREGDPGLTADANGKPHLTPRAGRSPLHLNTSDTAGMIIWTFSHQGPLGCDVERIGEDRDGIAESHFAPREFADYRRLSGERKLRRFYEIWTLKEAVLKADGRGLGVPLDSFCFRMVDSDPEGPPGFDILAPQAGPAPGPWRFHRYCPSTTHQAAVAVQTPVEVTFQCHLLHLEEFDPEFNNPWRFSLASDRDPLARPFEHVIFDPAG